MEINLLQSGLQNMIGLINYYNLSSLTPSDVEVSTPEVYTDPMPQGVLNTQVSVQARFGGRYKNGDSFQYIRLDLSDLSDPVTLAVVESDTLEALKQYLVEEIGLVAGDVEWSVSTMPTFTYAEDTHVIYLQAVAGSYLYIGSLAVTLTTTLPTVELTEVFPNQNLTGFDD